MSGNLVRLNLSRFTARDVHKLSELSDNMRLIHRWCRCERLDGPDGDAFVICSVDRSPCRYASYRIRRHEDGTYSLTEGYGGKSLADGRTMEKVCDALVNLDLDRNLHDR